MMTACNGLAWLQLITVFVSIFIGWMGKKSWQAANDTRDRYLVLIERAEKHAKDMYEFEKKMRGIK